MVFPRRKRRQIELTLIRDDNGNSTVEARDETGLKVRPELFQTLLPEMVDASELVDDLSGVTNAGAARTALGLNNVNNTSDANKPVSNATAQAIGALDTRFIRRDNLVNAVDGYVLTYDSNAPGNIALRPNEGGPATVTLLSAPLGNGEVVYSGPYDRDAPFPGRSYSTLRLSVIADTAFTVKLQTSSDANTWTDQVTYTVTNNVVDQTVTPNARYARWVFTATASGMTKMNAKAVLA